MAPERVRRVSEGPASGGPVSGHPSPRARSERRWVLPACLAIVLAVSLAIGSGLGRGHRSAAQRAASIEAQIRCPSCEDLSVLQSSTSAAVSVRNQIAADIARGWPDGRIEQALVARYGSTILLRPPTSGLTSVVWLVPAVAGAAALLTVGLLFWRRGRTIAVLRRQVSP